ncbi:MAG: ABC transporter ATP-binding protein, partial [Methylococcaceae bacterium]
FLGGHLVIGGGLSLGDFAAFNSYVALMIFPILVIGFMSNVIARSTASYGRIVDVLDAPDVVDSGTVAATLRGDITLKNVSLIFGEKSALKNVSMKIDAGTKVAILGPTAAGKTQLLYALIGLVAPTEGAVEYDGISLEQYEKASLYAQVGFVFQESIMFNLSVKENIAFSQAVTEENMKKAIETAELADFISTLPEGIETIVSERGTSLSGGQKQRIMLARALALNPKILLLDDFTARVDAQTQEKIIANIDKNYPNMTLVSVTQTIAPIEQYDQIILLMEGEVLAQGTHGELMASSPEYVQMVDSQQSTNLL